MALSDNLIAYWKLDETSGTREDSVGSNDLTDYETVLYDTGIQGNAADFELDVGECLYCADNADLSFADEDFSIVAWVKLETVTAHMGLVTKWDYTNNKKEWALYFDTTDDTLRWLVSSNGTAETGVTATTFGALSPATWYFVYVYHDATNDLLGISVNDGTVDTTAHATGCNDNTSQFALARFADATPLSYDGLMDEVGVWGRVLTSAEVTKLYNSGNGIPYPFLYLCLTGTITLAGAVTKKTSRVLAGSLVLTGTITKKAKKALAGLITFTGTITKKAKKALAGVLALTGVLSKFKQWLFMARFRDYFLTAPQRFTISSDKVQMTARYRDYYLTAPEKK